jgi:hypothetical protein
MDGKAKEWFEAYKLRQVVTDWPEFIDDVEAHFGVGDLPPSTTILGADHLSVAVDASGDISPNVMDKAAEPMEPATQMAEPVAASDEMVLTNIGGLSLFLELCGDAPGEVCEKISQKEVVWDEEVVHSPLTHISGLSLFREIILAATQPWCRGAFIPGFKEQRLMVCTFSDSGQRSLQTISYCDNLASPLTFQRMKNDEALGEQWDPGILMEKVFRLAVHDVDMTKILFLGKKNQILEAIGSDERAAPWPSWKGYSYDEILGFQCNASIHELGDIGKRTCVAPWPLLMYWFICSPLCCSLCS